MTVFDDGYKTDIKRSEMLVLMHLEPFFRHRSKMRSKKRLEMLNLMHLEPFFRVGFSTLSIERSKTSQLTGRNKGRKRLN